MGVPDNDNIDDAKMSFGEHLEELRSRLLRGILGTLAVFIVVLIYNDEVVQVVVKPYRDASRSLMGEELLVNIGVTQGFFSYMKVAIIVALLLGAPIWMYQFWRFISAGLYIKERRWVYRFAPLMVGLFIAGVLFGYFILIPIGLRYLLAFGDPTVVRNWIGLSEYLSFFTLLTLVLAITFELPIVMALLARIGVLSIQTYRSKRRHFILGAFIVAAFLTPPDAVTQTLMALPMLVLYEFGILLAWLTLPAAERRIEARLWRRRLLVAGAVIVVIALAVPKVVDYMESRAASSRVDVHAEQGGQGWTYADLFKRSAFLDFGWTSSFRLGQGGETEDDLWVLGSSDKADVVAVMVRAEQVTEVDSSPGESRFIVRGAGQSVTLRRVHELDGGALLDPMISAAALSGPEVAAKIDHLLFLLSGSRPAGWTAPAAGAKARDQAILAWRAWRRDRPDWKYHRGD